MDDSCVGSGVTHFSVLLKGDKRVYVPGERVEGRLVLSTSALIACSGLRARLEHVAVAHWHTGASRDSRTDYHGSRLYASETRSVWGNTWVTAVVPDAGANCVFGSPSAPRAGHVDVPLPRLEGSFLALRVCDRDRGRPRDDVLGECVIDVDALLASGGETVTLPLFRRQGLLGRGAYGPQLGADGAPSIVVVSAAPSAVRDDEAPDAAWRQGVRRVCVRVHAALNLRAADLVGENDVYCALYDLPTPPQPGAELPEPPTAAKLPLTNRIEIPFSFTLPPNCPSTLEHILPAKREMGGMDYAYVRCSVYAFVDIPGITSDSPSARALITVVQPVSASLPRLLAPAHVRAELPLYGASCMGSFCDACCCECCTCFCAPESCQNRTVLLGMCTIAVDVPRTGYAPGEEVAATLRVKNGGEAACRLRVELVRFFDFTSTRFPRTHATQQIVASMLERPLNPGVDAELEWNFVMPLAAPDYHGGALEGAAAALARFAPPDAPPPEPPVEPVLWRTALRVTLDFQGALPVNPAAEAPLYIAALPATAAALAQRPPAAQAMTPQPAAVAAPQRAEGAAAGGGMCFMAAEMGAHVDMLLLFSEPPPTAALPLVDVSRAQVDPSGAKTALTYAPAYFVAVPAKTRYSLSPYATTRAPIDVSRLPPGAEAFCPWKSKPFTVAQWLINSTPQTPPEEEEEEYDEEQEGEEGEEAQ
jgi:hypothetical protein